MTSSLLKITLLAPNTITRSLLMHTAPGPGMQPSAFSAPWDIHSPALRVPKVQSALGTNADGSSHWRAVWCWVDTLAQLSHKMLKGNENRYTFTRV